MRKELTIKKEKKKVVMRDMATQTEDPIVEAVVDEDDDWSQESHALVEKLDRLMYAMVARGLPAGWGNGQTCTLAVTGASDHEDVLRDHDLLG